mgnify:CR=1 FL=1
MSPSPINNKNPVVLAFIRIRTQCLLGFNIYLIVGWDAIPLLPALSLGVWNRKKHTLSIIGLLNLKHNPIRDIL